MRSSVSASHACGSGNFVEARYAVAGAKPRADDRGWGTLRGIDSSRPIPFIEDTDQAGATMNDTSPHLTEGAAALLAEPNTGRIPDGKWKFRSGVGSA